MSARTTKSTADHPRSSDGRFLLFEKHARRVFQHSQPFPAFVLRRVVLSQPPDNLADVLRENLEPLDSVLRGRGRFCVSGAGRRCQSTRRRCPRRSLRGRLRVSFFGNARLWLQIRSNRFGVALNTPSLRGGNRPTTFSITRQTRAVAEVRQIMSVAVTILSHSGRSRKYRREDRAKPQEDRRIGGIGKDLLRLLVCAIRLPGQ